MSSVKECSIYRYESLHEIFTGRNTNCKLKIPFSQDYAPLEIPLIFRYIFKRWILLQSEVSSLSGSVSNNDSAVIHDEINSLLCLISSEALFRIFTTDQFQTFLSNVHCLDTSIIRLVKFDNDTLLKLTENNFLFYNYLHIYMNFQSFITHVYRINRLEKLENHVKKLIADLVTLSRSHFNAYRKLFICPCMESLWALLVNGTEYNFWTVFNAIAGMQTDFVFIINLLTQLSRLQRAPVNNYDLVKQILEKTLTATPNDQLDNVYLNTLKPFIRQVWQYDCPIELLKVLWDYYSRRISLPSNKDPKLILANLNDMFYVKLQSYECDGYELLVTLLRHHLSQSPSQWRQIKSRIYISLSINKVRDLNDIGIYRVFLLLTALLPFQLDDVRNKLKEVAQSLANTHSLNDSLWKMLSFVVLVHLKENWNISDLVTTFNRLLEYALQTDHLSLVNAFVLDLDTIMDASPNLTLGQHTIFSLSMWLSKYIVKTKSTERKDLLYMLDAISIRIDNSTDCDTWSTWQHCLAHNIWPALQTVTYAASEEFVPIATSIAARIANRCSDKLQQELLAHYCADSSPAIAGSTFLTEFNGVIPEQWASKALQIWCKKAIHLPDQEDDNVLAEKIVQTSIVPIQLLTSFMNGYRSLVQHLSANITVYIQTIHVRRFIENMYGGSAAWHFASMPSASYELLAWTLKEIAPLLYNRHQSQCRFTFMISAIMLTDDVLRGKAISSHQLAIFQSIWMNVFQATLSLSRERNTFVERIIQNLVAKFIAPFSTLPSSPITQAILGNDAVIRGVVLEKIAHSCLKIPTPESDAVANKAIQLMQNLVQDPSLSADIVSAIIGKIGYNLCEIIILKGKFKNMANAVLRSLIQNKCFTEVQEDMTKVLKNVTSKFVYFEWFDYFNLMMSICKWQRQYMQTFLHHIDEEMRIVESKGVSQACMIKLRCQLERLDAESKVM